jgi:hypothetical protein
MYVSGFTQNMLYGMVTRVEFFYITHSFKYTILNVTTFEVTFYLTIWRLKATLVVVPHR